ncbi:uncharacterized protein LOC135371245 [Ornithodoros turicata]|uniref:uncharacterized protein LOC135371245 n=1 Tax=Ornithodoros turicata TaxID=34597 RepID=UPI003139EC69
MSTGRGRRARIDLPPELEDHEETSQRSVRRKSTRRRRNYKNGPDSKNSWVVALACAGVNVFMHASSKVVGVLFIGMLAEFSTSREVASWPLVLNNMLLNLAAPAFGFLSQFFPIRNIILASSALSSVSVALCFVASDVFYVSLLFGVIHGVATCGAVLMTQVCINQHFVRRRGTAAGIVSAISSINSLLFPPLCEFWMSYYGLQWTFLLLGACIMNAMAFAILVRSPSWLITKPSELSRRRKSIFVKANVADKGLASWITHFTEENSDDSSDEDENIGMTKHLSSSVRYFFSEGGGITTSGSTSSLQVAPTVPVIHRTSIAPVTLSRKDSEQLLYNKSGEVLPKRVVECRRSDPTPAGSRGSSRSPPMASTLLVTEHRLPTTKQVQVAGDSRVTVVPVLSIPTGYTLCQPLEHSKGSKTHAKQFQLRKDDSLDEGYYKNEKAWKVTKSFLTISFWHLTLSQFLVQFGLGVFVMTIIDYAKDCGIEPKDAVFFMTTFCVGDMLARLVAGVVTDRGAVHIQLLVAVAYALQGASYELMCYMRTYVSLLLLTLVIGVSHGCRIFMLPIFLTRSFGLRGLSINLSVATCICGLLSMVRPFLIGYYRDEQGTYRGLYHIICIVNCAVGVSWFIKIFLMRKRDRLQLQGI